MLNLLRRCIIFMNWNNEKSIGLTKFFIILFAAVYILVLVFCPRMTREFVDHSFSARGKDFNLFMATIYSSAVPLGIILWNLYRMIGRIGEEQIFSDENVSCSETDKLDVFCGCRHLPDFYGLLYFFPDYSSLRGFYGTSDTGYQECIRKGWGNQRRE